MDDDINWHKCIFDKNMCEATLNKTPCSESEGLYIAGFKKNNVIYDIFNNTENVIWPPGLDINDILNATDTWDCALKRIELLYDIPVFKIGLQLNFDGSSYDTKSNTSQNTYATALTNNLMKFPVINIACTKNKKLSTQIAILDSLFPQNMDPTKNRKCYRIVRSFIPDYLMHHSGEPWIDVLRKKSLQSFDTLSVFEQNLFPQGIPFMEWNFNDFLKGCVVDTIHCYYPLNFMIDHAERYKLLGTMPANARCNDQYSMDISMQKYNLHNHPCLYDNVLNSQVLCFLFLFLLGFFFEIFFRLIVIDFGCVIFGKLKIASFISHFENDKCFIAI